MASTQLTLPGGSDATGSDLRGPQRYRPLPASETEGDVGGRFDRVAARWPDRVAVDAGDSLLCYGELAERTDALRDRVLDACGGDGARVALMFEHPTSLVTAILGTLKAGCAYVPLDPSFPAARLHFILKDAETTLVLCDAATASLAREIAGGERTVIDIECDPAPGTVAARAPRPVAPDCIASILYTSGSTGEPKGVLQNHRNLLQYARNYIEILTMRPADRVSLLFSYGYSASIPDIFGSLLCGATLCPFDVRRRGVAALASWVRDAEISLLHMVPTVFRHFASRAEEGGAFPALRVVDLGGEAAFSSDLAAFARLAGPGCALIHRLAATEISLITAQRFTQPVVGDGALDVGRAVDGVEVRIAGPDGAPLAAGETGEIVLRSRYLSPGYWRRPEQTAATFRSDPLSDGVRLYHTGERGRISRDGTLEHRGRSGRRVKIRGHTVETGEVEAALRALPGVVECAVAATEQPAAGEILIAFVLLQAREDESTAWFRRALSETLPGWMVPARFEFLAEFPMTATGKVDRSRLLAQYRENAERTPTVPARTPIEEALVSIWRETLGNPAIGIRDDYFELGGTSLEAVQIIALIDERLNHELTPSVLVEAPTIEALAAAIERNEAPDSFPRVVEMQAGGDAPGIFCFPGNGGEPIVFQSFARHLGSERPCYGLRPPGRFGRSRPPRRIEEFAVPLMAAIREVQPRGPYYFAGFSFGSTVAIEVAHMLLRQGEEVPLIAMVDGWAPGHPRLRASLPFLHRLIDRAVGRGLLERHRTSVGRILSQAIKARLRDIECAMPELLGRELSPKRRRRRQKRTAIRARARYRPKPFAGRILLVRAADQAHEAIFDYAPLRGWDAIAEGGIDVLELPGAHLEMLAEPNARDIARWICEQIDADRPTRKSPNELAGSDG